jgi:hypothetical protein
MNIDLQNKLIGETLNDYCQFCHMDMSKFCVFTFIYLDVRDVDPIPNMVTSPHTSVTNANIF